ncbi:unnamed protein product [Orchesella dallaii]|uniref:Prolyl 4-hydroxylase subunit alpha-2 n=1 Tax=Orchesella dallaii TaxID=48710 RepID=A0ABP1Q5T1_9HEXA
MEWALDLTEKGEEYGRIYNYKWPNEDDLHMSHISILHMQEIYGFSPWQFHKGLTIQSSFGGVLKALHCANIAQAALSLGYYYMAIEWLEFTHELLSEDETDDSISIEKVEKLLDEAVKTHNDLFTEVENFTYEMISNTYTEPTYVGHPANERLTGRQKLYSLKSRKYGNGSDWEMNNIALCSGKEFQPIEIRSKMKCYLERKRHPYFILNPVKVEQLSEHPYIVQMYDVLGNKTIEEHYNVRRGFMKLSEVTGSDDLKARLKHRTSASGSLPDCELSDRINKKSEMLTGLLLDDTTLEGLQVAEYTYGRFYSPHVDPDILSFKLHEPDVGGFTPFTEVGIATPPILGSAVFWYDMKTKANQFSNSLSSLLTYV